MIVNYPNNTNILDGAFRNAPNSKLTQLAGRLMSAAKAYDAMRTKEVLARPEYAPGIQRDFSNATNFTADHIFGAPWADHPETPLLAGEAWNKGRRASLTGQDFKVDARNLPINPYLETGVRGRGVIGLYGPNHAVDIGMLRIMPDHSGHLALHAYGIMKGEKAAFCGGFIEYPDTNVLVPGRDVFAENQGKEFFEEMISGSVTLNETNARKAIEMADKEIAQRELERGGKPLAEDKRAQIRVQQETQMKLLQVQMLDPDYLVFLTELFQSAQECFTGPVLSSSRNTDNAWMESYLSWVFVDDALWGQILGADSRFSYGLAHGDDADAVLAHRIDENLMRRATGTHSAMFAIMAASFLLDAQEKDLDLPPSVYNQLESLTAFLESFNAPKIVSDPRLVDGATPT